MCRRPVRQDGDVHDQDGDVDDQDVDVDDQDGDVDDDDEEKEYQEEEEVTQQLPHWPWFFTSETAPWLKIVNVLSKMKHKQTSETALCLFPNK